MGIQAEYNPDLALRHITEFEQGKRQEAACDTPVGYNIGFKIETAECAIKRTRAESTTSTWIAVEKLCSVIDSARTETVQNSEACKPERSYIWVKISYEVYASERQ